MDPFVKDSALPFLAPQPSGSDEEFLSGLWLDSIEKQKIVRHIAAVRAEATLAADAAKDAQIAALRAALGPLACECSGQWCERSEWRPADIEHCARRAARAALEMSGGVL